MAYTTINKGSSYFNTVLYTGNGSARSLTGVNFKPDFVWIKSRSNSSWWHQWQDIVRGATKRLASNDTATEATDVQTLTSFDTDGFSLGTSTSYNNNADTYVAWNWLAANSTTSNTNGSITSTVSANTTAGFSIVSYTGTGANATVGHGLGSAPKMVIIKNRTSAENWRVGHSSLTSWAFRLILDATSAQTSEPNAFNSTAPTSTVFSVGTDDSTNKSTNSLIAYCFAEVKGYSKFGSYTGNGATDGTFIYTGFKPAFIITKRTDTTSQWQLLDNKRLGYNPSNSELYADSSEVENTVTKLDILSNGFKLRTTSTTQNASGGTYIYMAFAENPFVSSKGLPTTAR